MKIIVIIPAYNEEKTIGKVLDKLKNFIDEKNIVVIDDGSSDNTYNIAKTRGVNVYKHVINRGLGGAIGSGLEAALIRGADFIVTMDADEQHDPTEINKLVEPLIKQKADIVIGSRFLTNQKMPIIRKFYNWIANFITWIIFGIWTTDSQSGFRAFNKDAANKIEIKTNKMEVSSEIFKEIKGNKLRFTEVPIRAIYTEYSMSKGQNFFEGIKTIFRLLILRFRR
ncbi:MAG: glycosyltransferase family 2 protein [Patescibacteria group bacterium]